MRDTSLDLDRMGARVYAPDLGVWTSADPALVDTPERSIGPEFATGNAYAYANLSPISAIDSDGEFWHLVAGGVLGGMIGGGVEAVRQYVATGRVEDWGRVGAAAAGGMVTGSITAACPTAGLASIVGIGAVTGAAVGVTERVVQSGGKSAGTLTDVAIDASVGAATGGVVKGAASVVRSAARAAPKTARPAARQRALDSLEKMGGGPRLLRAPAGVNPWVGSPLSTTAAEELAMYRIWGGDSARVGSRLSPARPASVRAARSGLALPAGNPRLLATKSLILRGSQPPARCYRWPSPDSCGACTEPSQVPAPLQTVA